MNLSLDDVIKRNKAAKENAKVNIYDEATSSATSNVVAGKEQNKNQMTRKKNRQGRKRSQNGTQVGAATTSGFPGGMDPAILGAAAMGAAFIATQGKPGQFAPAQFPPTQYTPPQLSPGIGGRLGHAGSGSLAGRLQVGGRRLVVTGLAPTVSQDDLFELFREFGNLREAILRTGKLYIYIAIYPYRYVMDEIGGAVSLTS